MKINHIGYAVKNIAESVLMFEKLGFSILKKTIKDQKRGIEIAFMKNEAVVIELVSPLSESSPISNIIKKVGNTPYHLCFETGGLDEKITELKKHGFVSIDKKSKAVALNNKNVAFLYNKAVGIIELVES